MNTGRGIVSQHVNEPGYTGVDVDSPQQVRTLEILGVELKDETKGQFLQQREGIQGGQNQKLSFI